MVGKGQNREGEMKLTNKLIKAIFSSPKHKWKKSGLAKRLAPSYPKTIFAVLMHCKNSRDKLLFK